MASYDAAAAAHDQRQAGHAHDAARNRRQEPAHASVVTTRELLPILKRNERLRALHEKHLGLISETEIEALEQHTDAVWLGAVAGTLPIFDLVDDEARADEAAAAASRRPSRPADRPDTRAVGRAPHSPAARAHARGREPRDHA